LACQLAIFDGVLADEPIVDPCDEIAARCERDALRSWRVNHFRTVEESALLFWLIFKKLPMRQNASRRASATCSV